MAILLPIAVVLATLSLGLCAVVETKAKIEDKVSRSFLSVLTVPNGQTFGKWTWREMCPDNYYAVGFSLRVEPNQQGGDDTSLNGIRLYCGKPGEIVPLRTIESHTGHWGDWSRFQFCLKGSLISFQLRVEGNQGSGDDTAANNIKFRCSDNSVLEGDGNGWGEYGSWSQDCGNGGICGIETNMEDVQGEGDDTSLNDVRFYCCS